jgi:erythromycin esterase-like protein
LRKLCIAVLACCAWSEASASDDAVEWAVPRIVSLDTLRAVDDVVANARIVGLAEYSHLQPELLSLRNGLFAYLVRDHGVTAYAAETSFVGGMAVDDYVQGLKPDVPMERLVQNVFSWGPEGVEENRRLIEWMREYNARAVTERKLRFYGVDLTSLRSGADIYQHARDAVDLALRYAARYEPDAVAALARRLEPGLRHFKKSEYAALTQAERSALTAALLELEALFRKRQARWSAASSPREFERMRRCLRVGLQHDADFHADPDGRWLGTRREDAMAENVAWALEQEGPRGRLMLFASFSHLTRGPHPRYEDRQLGAQLAARWRGDFAVLGSYWPILDAAFLDDAGDATAIAHPLLAAIVSRRPGARTFLDLRARPFDARWTDARGPARSFFDAMIFIEAGAAAYDY